MIAVLIWIYGVESLHWDEWGCEVPVLRSYLAGSLDWSTIHAQCNESRPTFSKILWLLLTLLSGTANPRWEMFTGWVIVCATAWNVYRLSQRSLSASRAAWLGVCVSALLFSATQQENWLWGLQMMLFLPAFLLTVWLRIAFCSVHPRFQIAWGTLLAILATYSFANGFLVWPALFASLPLSRDKSWRWRAATTWTLALIATLILYFHDYQRSSASTNYGAVLHDPLRAMQYVLNFLGGPFAVSQSLATVIGFTLLLTLLLLGAKVRTEEAAPWLILAGYAIASAAMAAVGRAAMGPQQALDSRYGAFAVWLAVSVVSLGFLIPTGSRWILSAALAMLGILHGFSYVQGVRSMHYRALGIRYQRACLTFLFAAPAGDCAGNYPAWSADFLRESAVALDQAGWLQPRLFRAETAVPETYGKTDGNLEVSDLGTKWQMQGGVGGNPDAIVVAIRSGTARYMPLALTQATRVVPMRQTPCAWRTLIDKSKIPIGAEVAAFAYRATEPQWLQLGRSVILRDSGGWMH